MRWKLPAITVAGVAGLVEASNVMDDKWSSLTALAKVNAMCF